MGKTSQPHIHSTASCPFSTRATQEKANTTAELLTPQPPEGPTALARKQGHTLSLCKSRRARHSNLPLLLGWNQDCQETPGLAAGWLTLLRLQLLPSSQLFTKSRSPQGSMGLSPPQPHSFLHHQRTQYLWLKQHFSDSPQNCCLKYHLLSSINKGKGTACLTGRLQPMRNRSYLAPNTKHSWGSDKLVFYYLTQSMRSFFLPSCKRPGKSGILMMRKRERKAKMPRFFSGSHLNP